MDLWYIKGQLLQEENELKEYTSESQQVALNRLNTKIKWSVYFYLELYMSVKQIWHLIYIKNWRN